MRKQLKSYILLLKLKIWIVKYKSKHNEKKETKTDVKQTKHPLTLFH